MVFKRSLCLSLLSVLSRLRVGEPVEDSSRSLLRFSDWEFFTPPRIVLPDHLLEIARAVCIPQSSLALETPPISSLPYDGEYPLLVPHPGDGSPLLDDGFPMSRHGEVLSFPRSTYSAVPDKSSGLHHPFFSEREGIPALFLRRRIPSLLPVTRDFSARFFLSSLLRLFLASSP